MLNIVETSKGKVQISEKMLMDFLQNGPEEEKKQLLSALTAYADKYVDSVSKYQSVTETKKVVASTLGNYVDGLNIPFGFYRLGYNQWGKLRIYKAQEKEEVNIPNIDGLDIYVQIGDLLYDAREVTTDLSGWNTQFYLYKAVAGNLFLLAERCFTDAHGNNIVSGYASYLVPTLLPNS